MSETQLTELEPEVNEPVITENTMIRFSSNSRYLTAFAARDIQTSELAEIYKNIVGNDADPAKAEQKFIVSLDEKGLIFIVPQALVEFFPDKPIISFTMDSATHTYTFVNADLSYPATHAEFNTCSTRYNRLNAKPGYTVSNHKSTALHSTDFGKLSGANLSHDGVAGRVRMLSRDQLNHESICVMGRDRIKWLAWRETELVKQNNAQLSEIRELKLALADTRNQLDIETRINTDE